MNSVLLCNLLTLGSVLAWYRARRAGSTAQRQLAIGLVGLGSLPWIGQFGLEIGLTYFIGSVGGWAAALTLLAYRARPLIGKQRPVRERHPTKPQHRQWHRLLQALTLAWLTASLVGLHVTRLDGYDRIDLLMAGALVTVPTYLVLVFIIYLNPNPRLAYLCFLGSYLLLAPPLILGGIS